MNLSNVSKELAIALENLGWQEGDNNVEICTSVYEIEFRLPSGHQ